MTKRLQPLRHTTGRSCATLVVFALASCAPSTEAAVVTPGPLESAPIPATRPSSLTAGELRSLAKTITAAATDAHTGQYAYVRTKTWAASDTLHPDGSRNSHTVFYEEQTWRARDGSGRTIRVGPKPSRSKTFDYRAGELLGPVPEPLTADPATLSRQLRLIHPEPGPQSPARAVADVYTWHYPPHNVRAALLTILSHVHGLVWQGTTVDRARRYGAAVSVDSGTGPHTVRDTLVLDCGTGQLLAHEKFRLGGPMAKPELVSYVLYLRTGRRDLPIET